MKSAARARTAGVGARFTLSTFVGAVSTLVTLSACDRGASAVPPAAEFLVAAGDSTYWVRSGSNGIRVRSAPILLTQVDGRLYEVFIAEDGLDYADASFGMSRVWSRELLHPDSLLLFQDSTVLHEAAVWKRRHPREDPIDPDDEAMSNDPTTMVAEEIEIVDVHGPWLTFTHLLDVDTEIGDTHRHRGHRSVVDVRTGRAASLDALFGTEEASRVLAAGTASFHRLIDSIRTAGGNRADLARKTLESFRFVPTSFAITDIARAPAVSFMVPGTGADGEALALHVPPIRVAVPAWWASVQPTLPEWNSDSTDVRWERGRYRVSARPSADGAMLSLMLSGKRQRVSPAPREWPIANVASPAYQLTTLDAPPMDTTVRAGLARAFDRSTALDGLTLRVSNNRVSPRSPLRVVMRHTVRAMPRSNARSHHRTR